jgi:hypothetical protein
MALDSEGRPLVVGELYRVTSPVTLRANLGDAPIELGATDALLLLGCSRDPRGRVLVLVAARCMQTWVPSLMLRRLVES